MDIAEAFQFGGTRSEVLDGDHTAKLLVRSMVGITHELGFRVVAEGLETAAVEFSAERGCEEAQHCSFCRPVAPEPPMDWQGAASRLQVLATG